MIDYLRNRGTKGMNDYEFMNRFRDFMNKHRRSSMRNPRRYGMEEDYMDLDMSPYMRRHGGHDGYIHTMDHEDGFFDDYEKEEEMHQMMKYMRDSMRKEEPLSEEEAKHIVSEMYHYESGRKYSGEKFSMHKAKEVCDFYKNLVHIPLLPCEVYVAINAQYHDYAELFKRWFGDSIDAKIIESAITFWFKDVDAKSENKVLNYFR